MSQIKKDLSVTDRELSNYIYGCPSYRMAPDSKFEHRKINNILLPVFDEFQQHKIDNDIMYMERNMQRSLSSRLNYLPSNEVSGMSANLKSYVTNYYKMFKSKWYQRYNVISLSKKYNTSSIPLKYNIKGTVDLTLKTSYGICLFDYSYFINHDSLYFDIQHTGTRLQIAGRCMKLMTGKGPDLLGIILLTKKNAFRLYFRYLDEPYEQFLTEHIENKYTINKRYGYLCRTCQETHCTPFKTQERELI